MIEHSCFDTMALINMTTRDHMTKDEGADMIDLVIERARELREAGVLELGLNGLVVKLRSLEPDAEPDAPVVEETRNMWEDPATYGGGAVPGKTRKGSK